MTTEFIITTKFGVQVRGGNKEGWNAFFGALMGARAFIAEGFYIPLEAIDSIVPAPPLPAGAPPRSMAEVIHLVPKPPEPPQGAA